MPIEILQLKADGFILNSAALLHTPNPMKSKCQRWKMSASECNH